MNHASLFSGIGGFDLAAEQIGWHNLLHCEIDPFNRKILNYYWPEAKSYADITTTDFTIWRGKIGLLTGGFPCQPFSVAGKMLGTEDARNLWPEMLRAIREMAPRYVVAENVSGLLSWSEGLQFEQVCTDLEGEGYEVQPLIAPAAGVGAPHKRDRVWIVAYSPRCNDRKSLGSAEKRQAQQFRNSAISKAASNTKRSRSQKYKPAAFTDRPRPSKRLGNSELSNFEQFPTQPPIYGRNDGLSDKLDGITLSSLRRKSIAAYGNAIVPQVALQIFKAIEAAENKMSIN